MSHPCQNCVRALEGGVNALWEIAEFSPEALPPLPPSFSSWNDLREFLVRTVGHLREGATNARP